MDVLGELARSGGYTFDEAAAALERVKAAKAKLYEVDIHADPNAFLNWDKPLSGQPGVQQTLAKAGIINLRSEFPEVLARANTQTGGEIYESSKLVPGAYRDPQAASAALREMGIPGIRYLDQGSRQYQIEPPRYSADQWKVVDARGQLVAKTSTEQGAQDWMRQNTSSNYVMFDDKLIEILRKYGLLPPLAGAGLLGAGQSEP
jgi:hypothetical protein